MEYTGDLGNDKWLSIVDSSENSNNPCVKAGTALAAQNVLEL